LILQSVTGQQRVAYRHNNIAGLISEVSEEVATQIAKNCRRQPPHSYLTPPPTGTPTSIRMYLIFSEILFLDAVGLQNDQLSCRVEPYAYEPGDGGLQPPDSGKPIIFFGRKLNFSGRNQHPNMKNIFFCIYQRKNRIYFVWRDKMPEIRDF